MVDPGFSTTAQVLWLCARARGVRSVPRGKEKSCTAAQAHERGSAPGEGGGGGRERTAGANPACAFCVARAKDPHARFPLHQPTTRARPSLKQPNSSLWWPVAARPTAGGINVGHAVWGRGAPGFRLPCPRGLLSLQPLWTARAGRALKTPTTAGRRTGRRSLHSSYQLTLLERPPVTAPSD